jgi:hypothetical protein
MPISCEGKRYNAMTSENSQVFCGRYFGALLGVWRRRRLVNLCFPNRYAVPPLKFEKWSIRVFSLLNSLRSESRTNLPQNWSEFRVWFGISSGMFRVANRTDKREIHDATKIFIGLKWIEDFANVRAPGRSLPNSISGPEETSILKSVAAVNTFLAPAGDHRRPLRPAVPFPPCRDSANTLGAPTGHERAIRMIRASAQAKLIPISTGKWVEKNFSLQFFPTQISGRPS